RAQCRDRGPGRLCGAGSICAHRSIPPPRQAYARRRRRLRRKIRGASWGLLGTCRPRARAFLAPAGRHGFERLPGRSLWHAEAPVKAEARKLEACPGREDPHGDADAARADVDTGLGHDIGAGRGLDNPRCFVLETASCHRRLGGESWHLHSYSFQVVVSDLTYGPKRRKPSGRRLASAVSALGLSGDAVLALVLELLFVFHRFAGAGVAEFLGGVQIIGLGNQMTGPRKPVVIGRTVALCGGANAVFRGKTRESHKGYTSFPDLCGCCMSKSDVTGGRSRAPTSYR